MALLAAEIKANIPEREMAQAESQPVQYVVEPECKNSPDGNGARALLNRIPWLGGALAALVSRAREGKDERGELSDEDAKKSTPSPPASPELKESDENSGNAHRESVAAMPVHTRAHFRHIDSNVGAHSPDSGSSSSLTEKVMILGNSQRSLGGSSSSHTEKMMVLGDSQLPLDSPVDQSSEAWLGRFQNGILRFRSRSTSPPIEVTDDGPQQPHCPSTRDSFGLVKHPVSEITADTVTDVRPGDPQRSTQFKDPFVLSKAEELEHAKLREEIVRNFAQRIDNLEIGEKIAKATGDFGKNLGKAGDKLLKVWDLNDLKDDTIEMKEHYEEDIKEDLDKRVLDIKQDLGKHVTGV